MQLFDVEQLERAETYLADARYDQILPAFEGMAQDAQTYIDENCVATDEVQWFSFSSPFEKLTYRRIENDPRQLEDAPRPFDRLFADLAFCQLSLGDYESAAANLKQAVRWNPMNCAHRLNLSGVLGRTGDLEEELRMAFSVFARASKAAHLVRAYTIFADYFNHCEQFETAAACVKCGLRIGPHDPRLTSMATELTVAHQCNPREQSDELTESLLDAQGIPQGANVEVVISALLLADIAGARNDMQTCADMAQIAVGLVGQERANALAKIVADVAEETYPEEEGQIRSDSDLNDDCARATLDSACASVRSEVTQDVQDAPGAPGASPDVVDPDASDAERS